MMSLFKGCRANSGFVRAVVSVQFHAFAKFFTMAESVHTLLDSSSSDESEDNLSTQHHHDQPAAKKNKKTALKLPGSKASSNVIATLSKTHPGVFKKHSEYELMCMECRAIVSIRRGGAKDARKHAGTKKHLAASSANKGQTALITAAWADQAESLNSTIESEVVLVQLLTKKNVSFVACSEFARLVKFGIHNILK